MLKEQRSFVYMYEVKELKKKVFREERSAFLIGVLAGDVGRTQSGGTGLRGVTVILEPPVLTAQQVTKTGRQETHL